MLFNLLFTCVVLLLVCHAGWWWTQPASPWRSGYSFLALVTVILFVFWWLKLLGAIA
ncbi:MAG: hypothetical protein ABSH01_25140 [Terriglobia bacterium]|jgi:hypothetical protein